MSSVEKYKKEELFELIWVKKLSYREIGRMYGVSDTYIKKIAQKLGIKLDLRKKNPYNFVPHNKDTGRKNICKECGIEFKPLSYREQKCCSDKCRIKFKMSEKYNHYLGNQNDYCKIIDPRFLKKHILKEQNYCCKICEMNNEWNGKPIVFILDHIDGDASNNQRNNLRLVCPNCESQLDTYKSKNKNSARKERYLLNYKNSL
jgi:hypothetical protein